MKFYINKKANELCFNLIRLLMTAYLPVYFKQRVMMAKEFHYLQLTPFTLEINFGIKLIYTYYYTY